MLKNFTTMEEILRRQNSVVISFQVSLVSLLYIYAGNCQRALVDKSRMIITQMGMYNRSQIAAVQGSSCAPVP
jgi:hypothetical protein